MKITEETKIKDLIPNDVEPTGEGHIEFLGQTPIFLKIAIRKKSKTLEDYEKELNNLSDRIIAKSFFSILKDDYPKQYYSIILQMIADDICEEDVERHHILFDHKDNKDICSILLSTNYLGTVKFDTEKHAEQAVEIMGDKLKLLI